MSKVRQEGDGVLVMLKSNKFEVTKEGYSIMAETKMIGNDLLIIITGGTDLHIGDVTVGTKNTELQTIQFPSHDGRFHKDNLLSERIFKMIQNELSGSVTLLAGVHVDHITQAQINASFKMADDLGNQIKQWIMSISPIEKNPIYYSDDERPQ